MRGLKGPLAGGMWIMGVGFIGGCSVREREGVAKVERVETERERERNANMAERIHGIEREREK